MSHGGIEALADQLYERADIDADAWLLPSEVAAEVLGHDVEYVSGLRVRGRILGDRIEVRASLPEPIREWTIGHELGHFMGLRDERACDYFGAAVHLRRRPFLRALSELGDDWEALAVRFHTTPASAALRVAELTDRAIAVVTRAGYVYARGGIVWPDREAMRVLAREGGPGIVSTRLRGSRTVVLEVTGS